MMICCVNGPKALKDLNVKVDETDSGVTISVTSDKAETVEAIKKFADCCTDKAQDKDKDDRGCC